VIADGSDNFATRFIINDYAVKARRPWVMAGVVGAEGQVMPVSPGASACLRCVLPSPPPQCADPTCTAAGVIGPAVAAVAAVAACWVLRVLVDPQGAAAEARLSKLDLWGGQSRQIDVSRPAADCPCCVRGQYDYLDA
jgi:adenylyltransferase/sulfurtransferase